MMTKPYLFTELGPLVRFAILRAQRDVYDGRMDKRSERIIKQCSHLYQIDPEIGALIIYTRDVGHHSGGWWKNPQYERCRHLSVSFLMIHAYPVNAHKR